MQFPHPISWFGWKANLFEVKTASGGIQDFSLVPGLGKQVLIVKKVIFGLSSEIKSHCVNSNWLFKYIKSQ